MVRSSKKSQSALAFWACSLLAAPGCCCLERLPRAAPEASASPIVVDSAKSNIETVARGASPDDHESGETSIQLGPPSPIVAVVEPDSISTIVSAEQTNSREKCDFSWSTDKSQFFCELHGDLESLCTRHNALLLLAAGGVSFTFHETLDDEVAENTAKHSHRWGGFQNFIGAIGNPPIQLAAISGLYAYSLSHDDADAHELSKSLFNAVAITTASTELLKLGANTTRPNGDPYGWPSGHTSSSFAIASVLDEYYGHRVGVPAYALAGLVAWERIDDRKHDLSDVVFGAVLGYVIGRSVAHEHQARFCGMQIEPFTDPVTGATGVALERDF